LSVIWWQWCSNEPEERNPIADKTGEFCNKNQHEPNVWFFAGTFGGKAERKCIISAGKAILFTIINDLLSYAVKTWRQSDLRSYAKSDLNGTTFYKATVDDVELQNLIIEYNRIYSAL